MKLQKVLQHYYLLLARQFIGAGRGGAKRRADNVIPSAARVLIWYFRTQTLPNPPFHAILNPSGCRFAPSRSLIAVWTLPLQATVMLLEEVIARSKYGRTMSSLGGTRTVER